jgi:ubiquinone/menaquinone biosynthesis C-methylase UbiE
MVDKLKLKQEPKDPGKDFFERTLQKGLDYSYFGDWQVNYGKFVIAVSNVLPLVQKNIMTMLDVGTACGVGLKGIKLTGVFKKVVGTDISPYMIGLGKKLHGFTDEELIVIDARELVEYFEEGSFDLIHCSQTLEHIPEESISGVFEQFHQLLSPKGVLMVVVDAISEKQTVEMLKDKDPTHVTIQPRKWWADKMSNSFRLDTDAHQRFARTKFSPDNSSKTFYDYYREEWALMVGFKKK